MKKLNVLAIAISSAMLISISAAHAAAPRSYACGCVNPNQLGELDAAADECVVNLNADRIRPARVGDRVGGAGAPYGMNIFVNGCDVYINGMPSCTSETVPLEAYTCVGPAIVKK